MESKYQGGREGGGGGEGEREGGWVDDKQTENNSIVYLDNDFEVYVDLNGE